MRYRVCEFGFEIMTIEIEQGKGVEEDK